MSKTHTQQTTIDASIVPLTTAEMNHIRGGMASKDTEKAKKIKTNGVRNGWDEDWKEPKEEKIKKVKI